MIDEEEQRQLKQRTIHGIGWFGCVIAFAVFIVGDNPAYVNVIASFLFLGGLYVGLFGFGKPNSEFMFPPTQPPPPPPPKPLTALERRLERARTIVEADRVRKQFLRDNNIEEGTDLADQVNVLFSEYEGRLRDPDSE